MLFTFCFTLQQKNGPQKLDFRPKFLGAYWRFMTVGKAFTRVTIPEFSGHYWANQTSITVGYQNFLESCGTLMHELVL